ncbi:MAG TPA: GAF domain-containing protein [Chryseosolibacter sp.]|nr:GAF domain-containing protein [Chryseosolibacter sp.]
METSQPQVFPFKSVLSLKLLIEYWEGQINRGTVLNVLRVVFEGLDADHELRKPIDDVRVIEKNRQLVEFLMSAAIPPAQTNEELIAATVPFRFNSFYSTKAFNEKIDFREIETSARVNVPGESIATGKTIHACLMILNQYYGVNINFDKPILFTIRDPKTSLDKVYKIEIGKQFMEIVPKAPIRPIDAKIIRFLTEKVYDVDLWLQYIKPDDFEFHGFMTFRMVDVTEQEMLSNIKYDLLEKNAVGQKASFAKIEHKLRSIFGMPDIRLGVAFFGPNNQIILNSAEDTDCWKGLTQKIEAGVSCDEYTGSLYERSWTEKRFIAIENLEQYPYRGPVEEALIANGVRNLMLAPLIEGGETIGILEVTSPTPGKLNYISAAKIEHALPMFTAAVKRVKEDMDTEIRALIQQECTNIHPSVQWRFFEAGTNLMAKRRRGVDPSMEEIVFKDVYPLFGLADVRNSSFERSDAIQHDLLENLNLAKNLLLQIYADRQMPVIEEVIFKTNANIARLDKGLVSGDESDIIAFLKEEVMPLIKHFENDTKSREAILAYYNTLDPVIGVMYKRRKAFEQSLSEINKMIASHVDEAQRVAQQMFPHYFEKYQTDGIEYTMYIGSSIVKDRSFDPLYLKNFRLWQLMLMCEIDFRMDELKPTLYKNLDITQLILVQDQPLSIRFRADEKQFDVDGAYDIRYEIVKKRIDKALVKNTGERLTQPGKIAVVFNQAKMEDEYRRYFTYLRDKNLITGSVELLELEELPGANGLRALRVEVKKQPKKSQIVSDDRLKELRRVLSLQ